MRRVLDYDKTRLGQDTGWYCGPATVQTILSGRGIYLTEAEIAAQTEALEGNVGWDDRDGTDHISQLATVLNRYLSAANYRVVELPRYPDAAGVERLFGHIRRSIDAGYGVALNWVIPPSNRPRGVLGSQSPNYPSYVVYHYVCCMGYDSDARALWIVDSGFWPREYWISLDQCATLIVPKGYAYADAEPAPAGPPPPAPPVNRAEVLARATGLSVARAQEILPTVLDGLAMSECSNVNRIAMWLAQIGHESAGFNATEEYDHGRNHGDPNETSDRWRYKGRTWIQITWRANYEGFSRWAHARGLVPTPTYFVDRPRELADLRWAGVGPAWCWTVARPDINALSDLRDLETVTRRINGGTNGLADRRARYNRAVAVGDDLLILADNWSDICFEVFGYEL